MDNTNVTLWSREVMGRMICGSGGNWTCSHEVQYTYGQEFNGRGLFLLIVNTFLIIAAVTGIWPAIMFIQDSVNMLIHVLDKIPVVHAQLVEDPVSTKYSEVQRSTAKYSEVSWKDRLKNNWPCLSVFVNILLAGIMTDFICDTFGLPMISKIVQNNKYYCINMEKPDVYQSNRMAQRTSLMNPRIRSILADSVTDPKAKL
jgi:hypothetical protein